MLACLPLRNCPRQALTQPINFCRRLEISPFRQSKLGCIHSFLERAHTRKSDRRLRYLRPRFPIPIFLAAYIPFRGTVHYQQLWTQDPFRLDANADRVERTCSVAERKVIGCSFRDPMPAPVPPSATESLVSGECVGGKLWAGFLATSQSHSSQSPCFRTLEILGCRDLRWATHGAHRLTLHWKGSHWRQQRSFLRAGSTPRLRFCNDLGSRGTLYKPGYFIPCNTNTVLKYTSNGTDPRHVPSLTPATPRPLSLPKSKVPFLPQSN